MDATQLRYPPCSFSLLLDKGLLDPLFYLEDEGTATLMDCVVSEAWRVLQPGGVFIVLALGCPQDREQYFCGGIQGPLAAPWKLLLTQQVKEGTDTHSACYVYVLQKPF